MAQSIGIDALFLAGALISLLGFAAIGGWMAREAKATSRWKRRFEGSVGEDSIEYVIDDLELSASRDSREATERVSLAANLFGWSSGASGRNREYVRLTLDVPAGTPMAGVVGDIEKAGSLRLVIHPFSKEKEAPANEPQGEADNG